MSVGRGLSWQVVTMLWYIVYVICTVVVILHVIFPVQYHSPRFWRAIRKIPGPPLIPFFGTKAVTTIDNEGFFSFMLNIANFYRPLVRIEVVGAVSIVATEVNDAETILSSRTHITKSDDYEILWPWLGKGLLTSTHEKWFTHRRMLTPAFHFGIVENYMSIFSHHAKVFVEKLRDYPAKDGVPVNPLTSLCTLDIICETAMGISVNAQNGGTQEYVKAVLEMSTLFQIRQLTPWLYRDFAFALSSTGRRQKKVLSILHGFTDKVIEEKTRIFRENRDYEQKEESVDEVGLKKKSSFLDLLVKISEVQGTLTRKEIREEVDTFMFEGHDTTAAAISWAIFELSLNQEIQKKAQEEQDSIFGDSDRDPTPADINEMKYLEQIIKETLRLYPSVPLISRKLEEPITLSNYEVPAGANTAVCIYYIHRDPRIWPEPEKFDPDRFLTERIAKRHPYSYLPFSAGPRNCIGQKFALMEEKAVLSHILRKLNITPVTAKEDLHMMAELILRPKDNIKVNFSPREL